MALSPGTRFGPYEIAGEIGAGGMGVVYRATDTTLDRDVAIKVLPESMASDADRIARFDREAKTLASLNHPNIAQIYGLERSDGTTALVMELVEGPTLADRIEKGALPADEALAIAMQIAEALEAAHGQGIVHRDLKPANVKLRPDDTVKVLDFGIAKALEPENLTSGPQSPMMTTPATMAGVILGTAAYMSPEQAKGKPIDQRTDIWAFGCLLYEMLTGQLAFAAEDVPTTLARVIANEADIESLPNAISPAVQQTIRLCLQKDVRKRVADIRDVRLALEGVFESVSPLAAETAMTRPIWSRPLPVASTAVLMTGVIVGITAWSQWPTPSPVPEPPSVIRFDYDIPADHTPRPFQGRPIMALSPDGRHFVYDTTDGLYLRAMGELEARLIPGTEPNLTSPVFSPDGQWVAYWEGGPAQLKRIAISGGAPVVIASDINNPDGLSWEPDGTLFFGQSDGIHRVSANGGIAELIVPTDEGKVFYSPELLPDGDSVMFTSWSMGSDLDTGQVEVQSLSTGERAVLVAGGSEAHYLPSGHLVYSTRDGSLFAIAFSLDTLTVSGGPVPLVQGVMRIGPFGFANYSVSEDGMLVYATGTVTSESRELVWVDRQGGEEPINAPPRAYSSPRVSPDGTKVALNARDQETDIWIWDLVRETLTRLTFDPGLDRFPVWSNDGTRVAYSSQRNQEDLQFDTAVDWRAADGTGVPERLAESTGEIFPHDFFPDGTGILVYGDTTGANLSEDIAVVRLDSEGAATPLLQTTFREREPALSPDGRWLAYASDESGSEEVYVRPFPDIDGGRWQASRGGGRQPLWARDGQELFYRDGDRIMAVRIETDPTFAAGNPEQLFGGDYATPLGGRSYDVSLDGQQFLMMKELENTSESPQIVVVLNWLTELEGRLASMAE